MRLLFVFVFLLSVAFGQNCKYAVNGIDKFTNKMTKQTKQKKIIRTFSSEGFIALKKEDTDFSLLLSYRTSFSDKVKVEEGAELSFLVEGGKIITLKKEKGNYKVNKEQLKELMINPTKTIRYYYTDEGGDYKYQDVEIKKKDSETFINLIKCVL